VPTSRRRAPAVPLEHRPVALAPRGPPAWCTQVNTTQTRGNVSNRLASTGRNRLKPQARPSPLSAPTPHPRPHLVTHGLVAHFQEQRGGLGRRVTQQRRVGKPTKALWTRSPLIDPLAGQIPSYRESSPPQPHHTPKKNPGKLLSDFADLRFHCVCACVCVCVMVVVARWLGVFPLKVTIHSNIILKEGRVARPSLRCVCSQ
jgi:hypothetical protein